MQKRRQLKGVYENNINNSVLYIIISTTKCKLLKLDLVTLTVDRLYTVEATYILQISFHLFSLIYQMTMDDQATICVYWMGSGSQFSFKNNL